MPGNDESTEAKLQLCCDFHHFSAFRPQLPNATGGCLFKCSLILYRKLSQKWEVAAFCDTIIIGKLVLGLLELSH